MTDYAGTHRGVQLQNMFLQGKVWWRSFKKSADNIYTLSTYEKFKLPQELFKKIWNTPVISISFGNYYQLGLIHIYNMVQHHDKEISLISN